jgi:hypothetical protein
MLRHAALALAFLAWAASPALAEAKAKVDWVKPDAAAMTAAATGKPVCWYFLTGAAGADGKGSRPGC